MFEKRYAFQYSHFLGMFLIFFSIALDAIECSLFHSNNKSNNSNCNSNELLSIEGINIPKNIYNQAVEYVSIYRALAEVSRQHTAYIKNLNKTSFIHNYTTDIIEGQNIEIKNATDLLEKKGKQPLFQMAKNANISEDEMYHILIIGLKQIQNKNNYITNAELYRISLKAIIDFAILLKEKLLTEAFLPSKLQGIQWFGRSLLQEKICQQVYQIIYTAYGTEAAAQSIETIREYITIREKITLIEKKSKPYLNNDCTHIEDTSSVIRTMKSLRENQTTDQEHEAFVSDLIEEAIDHYLYNELNESLS